MILLHATATCDICQEMVVIDEVSDIWQAERRLEQRGWQTDPDVCPACADDEDETV